jgi:Uma2 family endonuclease
VTIAPYLRDNQGTLLMSSMTPVTSKHFTFAEYQRLVELGFLTEDDRVELIRGELIQIAAKGTLHSVCNTKLMRELERLVGERAVVRGQELIVLPPDSSPEPDIVIARGQPDDYLRNHPHPQDILLVIEITDSSLEYDQNVKLALYAEDQIQDYWIVNLNADRLERYRHPYQDAQGNFDYRVREISLRNEAVGLPQFPELLLDLNQVFPAFQSR